jgi:hypothetical protein
LGKSKELIIEDMAPLERMYRVQSYLIATSKCKIKEKANGQQKTGLRG